MICSGLRSPVALFLQSVHGLPAADACRDRSLTQGARRAPWERKNTAILYVYRPRIAAALEMLRSTRIVQATLGRLSLRLPISARSVRWNSDVSSPSTGMRARSCRDLWRLLWTNLSPLLTLTLFRAFRRISKLSPVLRLIIRVLYAASVNPL